MPTYEYSCNNCHHKLEVSQKITAEALKTCPSCSKDTLQRGPGGGIGLSFTGSGFYITDYTSYGASKAENSSSCCPCGNAKSCSS